MNNRSTGAATARSKGSMSIQVKIPLAIVITFITVLAASMLLITRNQRDLAEQIATEKAQDLAKSYFDGVNTMMLTGTLEQKETLRKKFLTQTGVIDVRIIQAPSAFPNAKPATDDLVKRALQGERVTLAGQNDAGRTIDVGIPVKVSSNYQGTNCLTCHPVAEGTVIGVIRAQYSLAPIDAEFRHSLLISGLVSLLLSITGIALVIWLLRHIVIAPLLSMRQTMLDIEVQSDLSVHLPSRSGDEIGHLAGAFNAMLDKFRSSLAQVATTGRRVSEAAEQVAAVSRQTAQAANQQRKETDVTRDLIGHLKDLASEVGQSAGETAASSVTAEEQAVQGTGKTREAITGIVSLVRDLEQAAEAIKRLDERSQNVSSVLDVIQGIAEQTNLLALNAAIEAARAGEAGRGFAVVADEVRNLASRSHESTRSIEEIVAQLQQEARHAVDVMSNARDGAERYSRELEGAASSLDNIVTGVTGIRALNGRMAQAVGKQGELTEDVTRRVQTINTIADRTSSDAVHTSDVSEQLVALAHELNTLVNRFKLN